MGFYVNQDSKGNILPSKGKVQALVNDGATILEKPEFTENLVCVVDNGAFEAAAFAYDYEEFNRFMRGRYDRPWTWLIYPHAAELSGYNQSKKQNQST